MSGMYVIEVWSSKEPAPAPAETEHKDEVMDHVERFLDDYPGCKVVVQHFHEDELVDGRAVDYDEAPVLGTP